MQSQCLKYNEPKWMSRLREIYDRAGFPSAFSDSGFEQIEINTVMSRPVCTTMDGTAQLVMYI